MILLCCNPDGLIIHATGVWYAKESIWTLPGDRYREIFVNWFGDDFEKESAGSMDDFVEVK